MASSNFIHPTLKKMLDETSTDFISRYLSVVQFDAPAANNIMKFIAGKNGHTKYACKMESTTRPSGGILGIDVIERIIVKRFGQQILKDYVKKMNYSWNKTQVIASLILLNISPLHHDPYAKLLYFYGKEKLLTLVEEQ